MSEVNDFCEIQRLSISYTLQDRSRVRALDNLNLTLRSSEAIGILGESGSGKSTLATAILRLLPAHASREQGTVLFRGRDLFAMTESELRGIRGREISLVSQDPAMVLNPVRTSIPEFTARAWRNGRCVWPAKWISPRSARIR